MDAVRGGALRVLVVLSVRLRLRRLALAIVVACCALAPSASATGSPWSSITYLANQAGEYASQPHVIKLTSGVLLAAYRHGPGPGQLGQGYLVSRLSTNGGATWSAEATIYSDATYNVSDVCLAQLANGNVIASFFKAVVGGGAIVNGVYTIQSANQGVTWGSPVNVPDSIFTAWQAESAPVVQLSNGNLLQPTYGNKGNADGSHVSVSTDGGMTWPTVYAIQEADVYGLNFDEPNILLLQSGTLLCLTRTGLAYGTVMQTSTNGGATWTIWTAAENVTSGQSSPHMVQLASGRIVVVQRDGDTNAGQASAISYSQNNGVTWSPFVVLPGLISGQSEYGAPVEILPGVVGAISATYVSTTQAIVQWTVLPESST